MPSRYAGAEEGRADHKEGVMKAGTSRKPCFEGSVVGVGLGRFVFAAAGSLIALAAPALAGPKGQQVVAGQATFQQNGATTTIHAGNNTIINYSSFNIGGHETVRFVQPSATSRVLNRVQSYDPTIINGHLFSNGLVYIANPAGIFFGGHAVVSVGGLVAAAGTITNQDFLAGADRFTGLTGEVRNLGTIQAGRVDMVGQFVANHGVIYADKGTVTMSAGDEVFIGPRSGGLYVKIKDTQPNPQTGKAGVDNSGTIHARAGASMLSAGDLYSLAVRNTGTVRADKITLEGKGAGVVHAGGTLDASNHAAGGVGGTVHVLGGKVGLFDANIDASGDAGGGTVLVGGDYQGHGAVRNAARTYVSEGTTIRADAVNTGDGGRVIVWADELTKFHGQITASGGAAGGDGGFAEVSGKKTLEYQGFTDLRADQGRRGTLLLDPNNLTIQAAGSNTNISGTGTGGDPFTTTNDNSILLVGTLEAQLGASDVVVQTGTGGTNAQDGDITIASTITAPGNGNSLELLAHDDIFLNANIDYTASSGDLILRADGVSSNSTGRIVDGGGTIQMGTGDLALSAGSGIGTLADLIEATGVDNFAAETDSGGIFFRNSVGGDLDITTVAGIVGVTAGAGNISIITTVNSLDVSADITGAGTIALTSNDDITVDADITAGGAITLTADSDTDGDGAFTLAAARTITATNQTINVIATDVILSGATDSLIDAGNGTVNLLQSVPTGGGAATIGVGAAATGTFNVSDTELDNITAGAVVIGDTSGTGAVDVNALGFNPGFDLSINGGAMDTAAITMGNGRTLALRSNGTLTVSAALSAPSGVITLRGDDLAINAAVSTGAGAGTVNLVPNAGRTVSISATPLQFDLSDAEIDFIQTSTLVIGASNSGLMVIDTLAPASTTDFTNLTLTSGSTIDEEGDNNTTDITIAGLLTLNAAGGIGVSGGAGGAGAGPLDINAASLAAHVSGAGGVFIKDTGGITLTDVDTANGDVAVRSTGAIIATDVAATGDVELVADAGSVTATSIVATGGDIDLTATTGLVALAAVSGATLDVVAGGGSISDTGVVAITGAASFTTTGTNEDITLDTTTAGGTISFNTVGANGDVIYARDGSFSLGASTVGGDLTLTSNLGGTITVAGASSVGDDATLTANGGGSLADSAALQVGGDAVFTTTGGGSITLDLLDVDGALSTIAVNSSAAATIVNTSIIRLAASNVTTNLTATAANGGIVVSGASAVGGNLQLTAQNGGGLSDSAIIQVTGNATFTTTGGGNVVMDDIDVDGGASTIAVNSSGSGTILNTTTVRLAASAVTGGLTVTATTGDVQVVGASGVGGNLSLTTVGAGSISDTAAIQVTGNAAFTNQAAGNISLDQLNVNGGSSTIALSTGGFATIANDGAVRLAASTVGTALTVTADAGNITDSGAVTADNATFTTGTSGADITLDDTTTTNAIRFNTTGAGGDATYTRTGSINLGLSNVGGALAITANGAGNITDSAIATVTGAASFTTVGGGSVTVDQLAVAGAISVTTPGAASVQNTAGTTVIGPTAVTGLLTITGSGGVQFGSAVGNVISAGSLDVTAAGDITDTGRLAITGTSALDAGGSDDVLLNNVLNDFGGTVTITGAVNASLADANDLDVAALSVTDLTLNAGDALTQSGAFTVSGDADVTGGAGGITLNDAANDFTGEVRLTTTAAGHAGITDANAIELGDSDVAGDLAVAATGDITDATGASVQVAGTTSLDAGGSDDVLLNSVLNDFVGTVTVAGAVNASLADANDLDVAALSVTDLALTAGDALTQSGAFTVSGDADVSAGANGMTLNAANDFTGELRVTTTGGGDATITDANTVELGTSSVSGDLALTATGDITDAVGATVAVTGTTSLDAGGAGDVLLDNATNDFTGAVSATGAGIVTLADADDIVLGDIAATTLNVTVAGGISDSGALNDEVTVSGVTTLASTGGGDIVLDAAGHDFGDKVNASTTGDATLRDTDAIELGEIAAANLSVTSDLETAGQTAIFQSGDAGDEITVAGTTTLDAGVSNIRLDTGANNFGTVAVAAAGSAGQVSVVLVDAGAIDLGASTIAGQLNVTSGGAITDSGTLAVGGILSLTTLNNTAGAASITLDEAASTFGQVQASTRNAANSANVASAISITESGAMNLSLVRTAGAGSFTASGAATLGTVTAGSLGVIAGGAITDSGVVTVSGDATFLTRSAGGADITLDSAASTFGRLTARSENAAGTPGVLTGGRIEIAESGVMTLLEVATTGDVELTASGAIVEAVAGQDAAADVVAANAELRAGGAIGGPGGTALETDVDALTAATTAAGTIIIDEADAINLVSVATADGDITVDAGGVITATLVQANSDVTLRANGGGIEVGLITAAGAAGTVTLETTGAGASITELGSDAASDINANTLVATVNTVAAIPPALIGGGTGGNPSLETDVAVLNATASGGVNIRNLDTAADTLTATVNSASGAVTIRTNGTLATGGAWTGRPITIAARDVNIAHTVTSSGASSMAIQRIVTGAVRIGAGSGLGMNISGAELALISVPGAGLTIGGEGNTTSITVDTVAAAESAGISGVLFLDATVNGGSITFTGAGASSFRALRGEADDGITIERNVVTTVGDLVLDGDADDAADNTDSITLNNGRRLTAAGLLDLAAATGGIDAAGAVTLEGGGGVRLRGDMTAAADATINADQDADGDGVFTIDGGRTVTADNLFITAAGATINGFIDTGSAGDVQINRSTTGTIEVGNETGAVGVLALSSVELSRITTRDLIIGDPLAAGAIVTGITVDRVTNGATANVGGTVTLGAFGADGSVTFTGPDVMNGFPALTVNTTGAATVNIGIGTGTGTLRFNNGGLLTIAPSAATIAAQGSFAQAGAGAASIGADITAANGDVSFASAVTLTGDATFSGTGVTLGADLNSDGTARAFTANTIGNGATRFLGAVGTTSALASLSTNADGTTELAGDVTATGGVALLDPVTLSSDVVMSAAGAGGVTLGAGVSGASASFTISAGGGAVDVTGGIDLSGSSDQDGGALAVDAAGPVTVTGAIDTSAGTSTGAGRAAGAVTVSSDTGDVLLGALAAVGGDATAGAGGAGGAVNIDAIDGDIAAGAMNARGGAGTTGVGGDGGVVSLDALQGSVRVAGIVSAGGVSASGAGGDGGAVTLRVDADTRTRTEFNTTSQLNETFTEPVGVIVLGGGIDAGGGDGSGTNDGVAGDINLNAAGRAGVSAVATILGFATNANGTFDPATRVDMTLIGRNIIVGPNEKIVVNGTFRAEASTLVRIGDVVAGGSGAGARDIVIITPALEINSRPRGALLFQPQAGLAFVLGATATTNLEGVDFAARGELRFERPDGSVLTPGDVTIIGAVAGDPTPRFAAGAVGGSQAPSGFTLQSMTPSLFDTLVWADPTPGAPPGAPQVVLDLNASGSSAQDLSTALSGALPRFEIGEVSEATSLDTGQRSKIRQLGINPRDPDQSERLFLLLGRALYNDFPQIWASEDRLDYPTVVNRLPSDRVASLLDEADAIFNTDAINPETNETVRVDNTDAIKALLTQAVGRYRRAAGGAGAGAFDGVAFRAYLEATPEEAESRDKVREVEAFLVHMEQLGLGPRELRFATDEIIGSILPASVRTVEQFRPAIVGPR
ncbi:MAG: filamentous hemagglutinin N-terminal domain-containing protein [Phycisphaerales bacterium]